MRELWKKSIDWDDEVPEDISKKWYKLIDDLSLLHTVTIERCINCENNQNEKKYELVTFTDAFKYAYAAVVYVRIIGGNSIQVNLIFVKSRLAPIKEMLIPQLELLGELIVCRVSAFVASELKIENIKQILLTDSRCVIEWCKSKRELKRFVFDKVKEIRSKI